MSEIDVSTVRVSYLAARVHDDLSREIRGDEAFLKRLMDLQPVSDLAVTLPFGRHLPVDTKFWASVAERPVQTPVSEPLARRLRNMGVPLRWGGTLESTAMRPRLEAHLHPFGVVALTTVDFEWTTPQNIEEVWRRISKAESEDATVKVGDTSIPTTLKEASGVCAEALVASMTDSASSEPLAQLDHRLATVINGLASKGDDGMPASNSPLHVALHHLAGGGDVIATPPSAFVPQWTDAGYVFSPAQMMYTLSGGSAILVRSAFGLSDVDMTASMWHRERLLLAAYVSALCALVLAAPQSNVGLFGEWGQQAAGILARMYGPAREYREWGLFPEALLTRTGAAEDVGALLGSELRPNAAYLPRPEYPALGQP